MPDPIKVPPPIKNWGSLGANALLSKTPNQQALAAVHKGLQDVPGGSLFEMYFTAATGRDVTGGGSGSGGLTPTQDANLTQAAAQSTAAAGYALTAASGFGGLDPLDAETAIAEAVWSYQIEPIGGEYTVNALEIASIDGFYDANWTVKRMFPAINFFLCYTAGADGNAFVLSPNLSAAKESARHLRESDYDFLTRVLPAYTWVADFMGTDYCGCVFQTSPSFVNRYIFYVPPAPSLAQIKALWDYTPTSGGGLRNGIEDSMRIWSLLPVEY